MHSHKRFETIISSSSSSCFFENDSFHSSRSLICERGERLMRSRHTWWIDYFTACFLLLLVSPIRLFNLLHDNIYYEEHFSWIIHILSSFPLFCSFGIKARRRKRKKKKIRKRFRWFLTVSKVFSRSKVFKRNNHHSNVERWKASRFRMIE